MTELSPLAETIWRRYGDAPGLVRTAPFLRVFERAERMSRLPLLDVVKRWIPADNGPFHQVGRGFAGFALPPGAAFPSARWPVPESGSAPIVSLAPQDIASHDAAAEGLSFREASGSRSDESPLEDHAGPPIVRPLPTELPLFPVAPDSQRDLHPQPARGTDREESVSSGQPGFPSGQPGFPIGESAPSGYSPPVPPVQAVSRDGPGQSARSVVRAVASDTSRPDAARPAVHSPGLVGRPFQLQAGASLEALSARTSFRAEPPGPPAVASVRRDDSEPRLPLVRLDARLNAKPDARPDASALAPRVVPPVANLPLQTKTPGPVPEPAPDQPHAARQGSTPLAGSAPLVVHADSYPWFDSSLPVGPQAMPLAPVVQRATDADAPSESGPAVVVSVPIRADVSSESALSAPEVNVSRVADQVYSRLVERLAAEFDRRGY